MLCLVFSLSGDRFALPAHLVEEVIPWIPARPVPGMPPYVPGVAAYRGASLPLLDLSMMAGRPSSPRLFSTRILVVRFPGREKEGFIGLIAENATETEDLDPGPENGPGFQSPDAPWLSEIHHKDRETVQMMRLDKLLSPAIRGRVLLMAGEEPEEP